MDLMRRVPKDAYPAGDMPEYPARVLLAHVLAKGVQLGAVAALIVTPLWAFSRGRPMTSIYHRVQAVTVTAGVTASLAATYKKHYDGSLTDDGVDDRTYRLSKNVGQNHIDECSLVGAGVGATSAALFGGLGLRSVFSGSVTGVAAGAAFYAIEKYINQQPEELK